MDRSMSENNMDESIVSVQWRERERERERARERDRHTERQTDRQTDRILLQTEQTMAMEVHNSLWNHKLWQFKILNWPIKKLMLYPPSASFNKGLWWWSAKGCARLVLVNGLGSPLRKCVVRLTDRFDMNIVVDWDVQPQIQQAKTLGRAVHVAVSDVNARYLSSCV